MLGLKGKDWRGALALGLAAVAVGGARAQGAGVQGAWPLFEEVTRAAGLAGYAGESFGASWGEVNGDRLPDAYISHHRQMPALYVSRAGGGFDDLGPSVAPWVALPDADTHGGSWADFDNDGDQDLYASVEISSKNNFLVNNGGRLVDQADVWDPAVFQWRPRLPIWLDFSGDGRPDFIMASGARAGVTGPSPSGTYEQRATGFVDTTADTGFDCQNTQQIYLADVTRDGRPEIICVKSRFPSRVYDVSHRPFAQVTGVLPSVGAVLDLASADFNGDLVADFFLVRGALRPSDVRQIDPRHLDAQLITQGTRLKSFSFAASGKLTVDLDWSSLDPQRIFIGSAGGHPRGARFTLDAADSANWGVRPHGGASGGVYLGYDDAAGRWQLSLSPGGEWQYAVFSLTSTGDISAVQSQGLEPSEGPLLPELVLSTGPGYAKRGPVSGFREPVQCVSAAAADFDNDMDVDLYLVCREGVWNLANRMYLNKGDGRFTQAPGAGGAVGAIGPALRGAGTGDSVALADYDLDGFMDLLVTNGLNMQPARRGGPDQLYRNQGNANHWIELDLVGTASGRDAVGARVLASSGGVTQLREHNGGYHRWSQNHSRIHFGLGPNTETSVSVQWPSGRVDRYPGLAADGLYEATEGGAIRRVAGP